MRLLSPAKVNLFFRVLRRRNDGYHEINSLFQIVDLADELWVEKGEVDLFTSDHPHLAMDSSNLVCKAVELFRFKTSHSFPVTIHLKKKIPLGSGLGGGSSNAATTLFALNALSGTLVSLGQLRRWSEELGSDVPFFFSKGSAFCQGRGEIVEEVNIPKRSFWIAFPSFSMSTQEVYQKFTTPIEPKNGQEALESFFTEKPDYFNDLEPAAMLINPTLKRVKEALLRVGFEKVVMTGSGSAFMCMGTISHPMCSEVEFFQVNSILKRELEWYEF